MSAHYNSPLAGSAREERVEALRAALERGLNGEIERALEDLVDRAVAAGDEATRKRTRQVIELWKSGDETAEYAKNWARDTVVRQAHSS